jgi:hypothetical protein
MTAVQWLVEQMDKNTWYDENGNSQVNIQFDDFEQAKEMEKQQIIDAYKFGITDEYVIGAEQYYKQTYNQ